MHLLAFNQSSSCDTCRYIWYSRQINTGLLVGVQQVPIRVKQLCAFCDSILYTLVQVYQGGIGSYALFVMVAAFLLVHPSRHPSHAGSRRAGAAVLLLPTQPGSLPVKLMPQTYLVGNSLYCEFRAHHPFPRCARTFAHTHTHTHACTHTHTHTRPPPPSPPYAPWPLGFLA